jgi:hypothetical protein
MQKWAPNPRAEMGIRVAGHLEPVGFVEDLGIVVGGAEVHQEQRALRDTVGVDLDVLERHPDRGLDRTVEAQQLLDGRGPDVRLTTQALELFGLAQQRQHAVADQVGGRLVSGEKDQVAGGQDLLVAQGVALFLGLDHGADEVVPGLAPALGDDTGEVGEELPGGGARRPPALLEATRRDAGDERARPLPELSVILGGHAEELGDHDGGKRLGQVVDELQSAVGRGGVEPLVDDLLDPATQLGHPPGSEGLVYELAQSRVIGRVRGQHRAQSLGALLDEGRQPLEVVAKQRSPQALHREARVAQRGLDIPVAREEPGPGALVVRDRDLEDRPDGAKQRVDGVGVLEGARAAQGQQEVELLALDRGRNGRGCHVAGLHLVND